MRSLILGLFDAEALRVAGTWFLFLLPVASSVALVYHDRRQRRDLGECFRLLKELSSIVREHDDFLRDHHRLIRDIVAMVQALLEDE